MSFTVKLLLGLVVAAVAATLTSVIQTGAPFQTTLLIAFVAVALVCTVLGNARGAGPRESGVRDSDEPSPPEIADGDREYGKVKWFNVSKGFGFIIKDDGEEIFVHFRSIRGRNRRGLRDGQRVSFVVEESDKGPQAEDVTEEP